MIFVPALDITIFASLFFGSEGYSWVRSGRFVIHSMLHENHVEFIFNISTTIVALVLLNDEGYLWRALGDLLSFDIAEEVKFTEHKPVEQAFKF